MRPVLALNFIEEPYKNTVWPSLLEGDKLSKLVILQAESPNPEETALQVWSRALKAEKTDIENWLRVHPRVNEVSVCHYCLISF